MRKLLILTVILLSSAAMAKGKGGFSMGGTFGIASTGGQTDMNALIKDANQNATGLSVSELGSAWEFGANFSYRFSGSMVAMQFKPSYFTMSEAGSDASSNKYNYDLSAYVLFLNSRFYVLESKVFKFFMQAGAGWAFLNGNIKEAGVNIDFSGNAMGLSGGLGAEFCFGGSSHCMVIEGNLRYLSVSRVIADSVSGTPTSPLDPALANGSEVEINGTDLGASLSGIVGNIGYTYYF